MITGWEILLKAVKTCYRGLKRVKTGWGDKLGVNQAVGIASKKGCYKMVKLGVKIVLRKMRGLRGGNGVFFNE
jgi:hypothetical protein